ncbi:sporulation histidine kinase inhibitor Sda [Halalkalibacter alkaliphilus]|uniref:Sporulation histidine kinase inhibitor Sda n=1 Tax=Halalkalibacter alkaliphilus TaxID=2917993 RepID=A0A9X2A4H4_9BACI|nr:sporulation histidine kinase inhibitor Sda [Halalkalibacter alkaliphilus]MCL7746792.1 sporulation histidine kinase inhibitor Sda [Halalkalibacter alkaliphilus]
MKNTFTNKGLGRLDHEVLLDTRQKALTLQLDPKFIELIEKEIELREKLSSNKSTERKQES